MKKLNEEELRAFIERHNIPVRGEENDGGTKKILLRHCVFDESHNNKCATFLIYPKGSIGYKCQHNSCKGKGIADVIRKYEPDFYKDANFKKQLPQKTQSQEAYKKPVVKSLDDFDEEAVEWLIPNTIPKGSITLLAGDGGTGKTFLWCNIVAAVTSGGRSILEADVPFIDSMKLPEKRVMFFSSEDSTKFVLKRRLRKAGANTKNVRLIDLSDEDFSKIKFDSQELADIIGDEKPALCVFDPIQSFIPATVNMSSRNAMRQCLEPLATLGEKYGTSFLIVLHTNKKQNVYGRTRIADSADIWDASRSVLMSGYTGEKGKMYLSHEKSNYDQLQDTILYTVEDEQVKYCGTSDMRDADYMRQALAAQHPAPARDDAKGMITDYLQDKEWHPVTEMDEALKAAGVSFRTLKRAKAELKEANVIKYKVEGFKPKVFYVQLCSDEES